MTSPEQGALPICAKAVLKPFTYAYRYPWYPPVGATVIRFDTGGREINGAKPIEAIPLYGPEAAELVGQLVEALIDWRNSYLCPATDFEAQTTRLLTNTDAALARAEQSQ